MLQFALSNDWDGYNLLYLKMRMVTICYLMTRMPCMLLFALSNDQGGYYLISHVQDALYVTICSV